MKTKFMLFLFNLLKLCEKGYGHYGKPIKATQQHLKLVARTMSVEMCLQYKFKQTQEGIEIFIYSKFCNVKFKRHRHFIDSITCDVWKKSILK